MSIICVYLCIICLTISQVKSQDAPSNEPAEANEIESPVVPFPAAPPPTAPPQAVPSPSTPPLTAQSLTIPPPTAPPQTAQSPIATPPTTLSPTTPSLTAPSLSAPSQTIPSPIVPYLTVSSPTSPPPIASSPTTPSPTSSPVTATSPTVPPTAIPSPTLPSPTVPSPTVPSPTVPSPTVLSATTPSLIALSPTASSPIAPSLTTPSSTTSPLRITNAIARVEIGNSTPDAEATDPDGNSGETVPGNVAPNTEINEQSTAATSADAKPDASTTASLAPSNDEAQAPSEGTAGPEPDGTSTAAAAPTNELTTTRSTDDVVTTTCEDNATETTIPISKTTKSGKEETEWDPLTQPTNNSTILGANEAGVCTLTNSIQTTKRIPKPVPAINTRAPHSATASTARGHGVFAGDMPDESTTKVYTEEDLEWAHVRHYDWIVEYLRSLARRFPKTTKLQEIGRSKGDLPIYAIEMTHKMHSGASIVIDAAMNGKDTHSVSFATFILHKLIERLNENLLTLTGVKIIIIPVVNPDNYKRFTEGADTEPCRETMFMNFDVGVPPPPSSSCSGIFFSEPESRAIRDYFTQLSKLKLYISLASSKRVIAFPYGYRTGISRKSSSMAENMKNVIDSKDPTDAKVITTNLNAGFDGISGTPVDWAYDTLNVHYALNVHLPQDEPDYEYLEVMYAYYEAIRYAVLQIQLTDSEVALAIYEDFKESSAPVRSKTFILPVILILICLK